MDYYISKELDRLSNQLDELEAKVNESFWNRHRKRFAELLLVIGIYVLQGSFAALIYFSYVDNGLVVALVCTGIATWAMYWVYSMVYVTLRDGDY